MQVLVRKLSKAQQLHATIHVQNPTLNATIHAQNPKLNAIMHAQNHTYMQQSMLKTKHSKPYNTYIQQSMTKTPHLIHQSMFRITPNASILVQNLTTLNATILQNPSTLAHNNPCSNPSTLTCSNPCLSKPGWWAKGGISQQALWKV